jgi:Calcineurin-like phosphoesterase
MSKCILLGDTHLGARNASSRFSNLFNKFFECVLYPYMERNGITKIYQLGDLFDNRTNISLKALHNSKEFWFEPLKSLNAEMHVLLGNHDIYHKNTLEINSPNLLLGEYSSNVIIYNEPTTIDEFDIIPWICSENQEQIVDFINRKDKPRFCLGHFEISGFSMYRGGEAQSHGLATSLFDDYEMVFSGHYHHRSTNGNITYVGTPYEITWSDYADPKGFHVLDTETGKIEFIENPYTIFRRVQYNNGWGGNLNDLKDCIVKVIVQEKQDLYKYDRFIDSIKLVGVHDLAIIENLDEFRDGDVEESIDLEDSVAIIDNYIDGITTNVDKDKIKSYMRTIYNEALTI